MTNSEFSNEFDVLYNNITSNQAPGLDEYEKSVFLTKALNQIILSYLEPSQNRLQEGYDGSPKRQVDFAKLTVIEPLAMTNFSLLSVQQKQKWILEREDVTIWVGYEGGENSHRIFAVNTEVGQLAIPLKILSDDFKLNTLYENATFTVLYPLGNRAIVKVEVPGKFIICFDEQKKDWMLENGEIKAEKSTVNSVRVDGNADKIPTVPSIDNRGMIFKSPSNEVLYVLNEQIVCSGPAPARLTIVPIDFAEYSRLMSKPYKFPLKNQAWRLLHSDSSTTYYEVISPYNRNIASYTIRYVKKPMPIILTNTLGDLGLSIEGYNGSEEFYSNGVCCEAPEILHEPILQRAVELAKAAYVGDLTSQIGLGTSSQTEIGMVTLNR